MLLGRSSVLRASFKNGGQMAAQARMEFEPHPGFSLIEGPVGVFNVEPGRSVSFAFKFEPQGPGAATHEARLRVQVRCCMAEGVKASPR